MNETMKSNLSLGLLALVAVLTVYNTFIKEQPRVITAKATETTNANLVAPNQQMANNQQIQQQTPQNNKPALPSTSIKFDKAIHDFGTIDQNTENKHVFKFTNTGSQPLVINDAKGSCGCTVPKYPKQPIAPGESAEIEVVYSPGTQEGNQVKTVSITANTEPSVTNLQIKAFVQTS